MTTKRKGISKKRRFEIFKRDGFACQYCGSHPPSVILHVDHIVAVAAGGGSEDENLVTACESCNLGKGARALSNAPESLSAKAAIIAEREAQLRGYSEIASQKRDRLEREAWQVADIFIQRFDEDGIRREWLQSIKNFVDKLGVCDVMDAMDVAVSKSFPESRMFRYFCGVCWGKIRDHDQ